MLIATNELWKILEKTNLDFAGKNFSQNATFLLPLTDLQKCLEVILILLKKPCFEMFIAVC